MHFLRVKYFKLVSIVLILSLHGCNSSSQILSKNELLEDLNFLNRSISAGHPVTLNSAWENRLDSFVINIENQQPEEFSAFEYENSVREALTTVGCAHTIIKESPLAKIYLHEIGENIFLPIRCFADSSGLYLIDVDSNMLSQQIALPAKIVTINGKTSVDIINKLIVYQPVDGYQRSLGYSIINDYSEILIRRCFIGDNEFTIVYLNDEGEESVLNILATKKYSPGRFQYYQPESAELISGKSIDVFQLTKNSMYLRMKSMDYENFRSINKQIFEEIDKRNIENLIIDLRGNGGGTPKSTLDFLSYILSDTLSQVDIRPSGDVSAYLSSKLKLAGVWFWDKTTHHTKTEMGTKYITRITYPKEKQYKGEIYILTDGYTASSASILASYLKYKAGAICIGQETAGGETGCNANSFQTLTLPNSMITINFPIFRWNIDIPIPDNHNGVTPKHKIHYNAKLYMQNRDLEIEKAFSLINYTVQ